MQTFFNKHTQTLALSSWCETEFYGALGRRVRAGRLPGQLAERAARRYQKHVRQGLYHTYQPGAQHFGLASSFTRQFGLGIKAPDALHLAVVQHEGCALLTSDKAMAVAAQALSVIVTSV